LGGFGKRVFRFLATVIRGGKKLAGGRAAGGGENVKRGGGRGLGVLDNGRGR